MPQGGNRERQRCDERLANDPPAKLDRLLEERDLRELREMAQKKFPRWSSLIDDHLAADAK
jgi:hypothetical protein